MNSLTGILTEVTDKELVIDNKEKIKHAGYKTDDLRSLVGTKVYLEYNITKDAFGNDVKNLEEFKRILIKSESEVGNIINMVLDTKENPFSQLSLDSRQVQETAIQETAYCVSQTHYTNLKSSYYTFELRDKYGRKIKANLFTEETIEDLSQSIVIVSILRKGGFYNIDRIILDDSIRLENPLVQISKDYIKNLFNSFDSSMKDVIDKLLEFDLTEDLIIKFGYQLNLTNMLRKIVQFDEKIVFDALAYEKLAYIEPKFKKLDKRQIGPSDKRLFNAIMLKVFSTEIQSMFSEDAECFTTEKEILNIILNLEDKLFDINFVYDYRRIS